MNRLFLLLEMKITIKVNTNAKCNSVKKVDDDNYLVSTTTQPEKGKANEKIIQLLADFFDVRKSQVFIESGKKSSKKIVEIVN